MGPRAWCLLRSPFAPYLPTPPASKAPCLNQLHHSGQRLLCVKIAAPILGHFQRVLVGSPPQWPLREAAGPSHRMLLCEPIEKSPWKSSFGPGASGERIGDNGGLGNKRHHCSAAWAGVTGCLARTDSQTHAQAMDFCFPGLSHEPHGGGDGGSTVDPDPRLRSVLRPLPRVLSQAEELHSAFNIQEPCPCGREDTDNISASCRW